MFEELKYTAVAEPEGPSPGADPKAPAAGTGENPFLRAALMYAARGWRVHPLRPRDKAALLKGWPEQATTDADTIRAWWAKTPTANVGLVPGPRSAGLAVIDVDPRNGGLATFETLRGQLGPRTWKDPDGRTVCQYVPLNTLLIRSGSGGYHLYYDASALFATGVTFPAILGPGVELHANDKLNIVAPPSVHPNGDYYTFFEHAPLAALPREWLPAAATPPVVEVRGTADERKARQALADLNPERADRYDPQEGGWLAVGMALHAVSEALLPAWDQWSRTSEKWRDGVCAAKWAGFRPKEHGLALESLLAWAKDDTEARGFITAAGVTVTPVEWLWYGRVAFGKLQGLIGMPDQGKDAVMLDLAARLSRGLAMPDNRPATRGEPRPTYYLSVEDALADTLKPRF